MDFKEFANQVDQLARDAFDDQTIHLRRSAAGEIRVICGYVSPEFAGQDAYITGRSFSVCQYKAGEVDLTEAFQTMMDEVTEFEQYR